MAAKKKKNVSMRIRNLVQHHEKILLSKVVKNSEESLKQKLYTKCACHKRQSMLKIAQG